MTEPEETTSPAVRALLERRSVKRLTEPGPTDAQLDLILEAATTVPDHNELRPWRFVVVAGDDRARFGAALEEAGIEVDPEMAEPRRKKLRDKAFAAPAFVVIVFSPKPGTVDEWEQEASAAATGYAMALTAHLLGLGSIWKSASVRTGTQLATLLDMTSQERLMGWVNLGTPVSGPQRRSNPVTPAQVSTRLVDGRLVAWDQSEHSGQA